MLKQLINMLINIDPLLSPELLLIMRSMGHGDKLVLCDANFPAHQPDFMRYAINKIGKNNKNIQKASFNNKIFSKIA